MLTTSSWRKHGRGEIVEFSAWALRIMCFLPATSDQYGEQAPAVSNWQLLRYCELMTLSDGAVIVQVRREQH